VVSRVLEPEADPLERFSAWFEEARAAGIAEVEAVCLATAAADAAPSARMVLFKGLDAQGRFTFFTNHQSRKGGELAANPRAALVFWWRELERQVRVEGAVERLSEPVSDAYYDSRPRGSRIAVWASAQSAPVADRAALEARFAEAEARFAAGEIPRPGYWGGYGVVPHTIEFWTGFPNRFHDRLRYRRGAAGWTHQRLMP